MVDLHPDLDTAEKAMWGVMAEALAFGEVYRTCQCDASAALLAAGILERYVASWDAFARQLVLHGRPARDLTAVSLSAQSEDLQ